jgi:hypothetical protein
MARDGLKKGMIFTLHRPGAPSFPAKIVKLTPSHASVLLRLRDSEPAKDGPRGHYRQVWVPRGELAEKFASEKKAGVDTSEDRT